MLVIVRLGVIYFLVFGGFVVKELVVRIDYVEVNLNVRDMEWCSVCDFYVMLCGINFYLFWVIFFLIKLYNECYNILYEKCVWLMIVDFLLF